METTISIVVGIVWVVTTITTARHGKLVAGRLLPAEASKLRNATAVVAGLIAAALFPLGIVTAGYFGAFAAAWIADLLGLRGLGAGGLGLLSALLAAALVGYLLALLVSGVVAGAIGCGLKHGRAFFTRGVTAP